MGKAISSRANVAECESAVPSALAGLLRARKELPAWLLYDAAGCELYERITTLPEYYVTRAETEVLTEQADALVAQITTGASALSVAELGAGTAKKTQVLLSAALETGTALTYLAADIAEEPLVEAKARLNAVCPALPVELFVGTHEEAGPAIARLGGRQVALFLGSSIGNYSDAAAIELLAHLRRHLRDDAYLVLGTDLKKDQRTLVQAYDDAEGVTAMFTKNVLARLNREYGCTFVLSDFRHVAEWLEERSDMELSLEVCRDLRVTLGAIGCDIMLHEGERIVIEICAKYDRPRLDRILAAAGFSAVASHLDQQGRYALQVARAAPSPMGPGSGD